MSKPTLLITGGTGHLGFRTLVFALKAGYRTRVAVRRLEQADNIKQAESIRPFQDNLDFVQVPDITKSDAYEQAVEGIEYMLHIASPIYDPSDVSGERRDWNSEFYVPAAKGTLSALSAALKAPNMKRVVITSSVAAQQVDPDTGIAGQYDFKSLPDEETLRSFTNPGVAYMYSKVIAHEVGTEFMRDHPKAHFDLVRVMPGYIQGANELVTSPDDVGNGSNEGTLCVALGQVNDTPKSSAQAFLDDVARAHVLALDPSNAASGQNLTVVSNNGAGWPWDDFVPVVEKLYPDQVANGSLSPKAGQASRAATFDVTESQKSLGFEFAEKERMVESVVGQYLHLKSMTGK